MAELIDWGPVVSSYTRRQAIEDGALIDLSDATDLSGQRLSPFKFPLAITAAAFDASIAAGGKWVGNELKLPGLQDVPGRTWDVMWMMLSAIRRSDGGSEIRFQVSVLVDGVRRRKTVHLKSICGPGDNGEPVLTVMLPEED